MRLFEVNLKMARLGLAVERSNSCDRDEEMSLALTKMNEVSVKAFMLSM